MVNSLLHDIFSRVLLTLSYLFVSSFKTHFMAERHCMFCYDVVCLSFVSLLYHYVVKVQSSK